MPARLPSFVPFVLAAALAVSSVGLGGCGADASTDVTPTPPVTNAACFGPDGTSQKYALSQDASDQLIGTWDRCESTLPDIPANTIGLQFDGKFAYFLVPGPDGKPIHGASDAYIRSVQVRLESSGIVLVLSANDGTFATYAASITSAPNRLRLENTTTHAYMTLGFNNRI